MIKSRNSIQIIPMVEVDQSFLLPKNSLAEKLVEEIKVHARDDDVIRIPGGFFVALEFLHQRKDQLLDHFIYQYEYYKGLEIGGGFNFIIEGISLGIPLGASFPLGIKLIDALTEMAYLSGKTRLYVSSQDFWDITKTEEDELEISVGKIANRNLGKYKVLTTGLNPKIISVRKQVQEFSSDLERRLSKLPTSPLKPGIIMSNFGMK